MTTRTASSAAVLAVSTALCAAVLLAGCSAGITGGNSSAATTPATMSTGSTPAPSNGSSDTGQPSDPTSDPASVTAPPLPTGLPTTNTGGTGSHTNDAAHLPQGFPLPPGARVTGATRDDHEIDAQVSVTDHSKAFTFWRSALPGAGYRVTHTDSAFGGYEIDFSGHGCTGDSQIAISPSDVAVQCDLG